MVRRTFRFGLRAGLLAGIVFALIKILQSRRASQEAAAPPAAWPRVPTPSDAAEPGIERPTAAPAAPSKPVAPAASVAPTTKLQPEPLTPAEPAVSTPPPSAPAPAPAPGTITQQPAGRVRPLKATKAPAKATKKAAKAEEAPGNRTWITPISDDLCPQSHPVKAKMASRIFHIPGGQNYARCRPDRCYESEQAAEADGFSRSKR